MYDQEGAYAVVDGPPSDDGLVTLTVLEPTLLGTYRLSDVCWRSVDPSGLKAAPMVRCGRGYVLEADLDDRPIVVAEPSLVGFIVPDHPEDEFVEGRDEWARSTHVAVREFDAARPTQPGAKRFKRMVGAIEGRARARRDEARFKRGESA